MNTKALWIILIIALVAIGAWLAFEGKDATESTNEMNTPTETSPTGTDATDAKTVTVTYTDSGFSPQTLTVSTGDTVRFVNQSSHGMWVGADEHPTHTEYDGTSRNEHCPDGGSFDQCVSAGAGGIYEFTFTKPGTFGYHNHVRAADSGTVVVE